MLKEKWESSFVRYVRRTPLFQLGIALTAFWVLIALLAPVIAPHDPIDPHPHALLQPPSRTFWLGTDKDGLDIFSRILYAPRIDLGIALTSTAIASVVGVLAGTLGGYFIGRGGIASLVAEWGMRGIDVIQAFPVFIFALALVAMLGRTLANIILAMVFVNTPVFVWLTRSEVLSVRQRPFIEAARCAGNGEFRIALLHVLPNSLAPALTQLSVVMGFSVLLTAGLSFVGAGVRIPTPEWGLMISQGATTMITGQWWVALFPGLALASAVFGFALVGDSLRNYIDPKRRVVGLGPGAVVPPAQG